MNLVARGVPVERKAKLCGALFHPFKMQFEQCDTRFVVEPHGLDQVKAGGAVIGR